MLTGNYGFSSSGFTTPPSPVKETEVPVAVVGVFAFDGAGDLSAGYISAFKGVIAESQTSSGTYTVNVHSTHERS